MCLCVFLCTSGRQLDRSEQLDSPGARVTGGSELSDIGAGICGSLHKEKNPLLNNEQFHQPTPAELTHLRNVNAKPHSLGCFKI